MFEPRDALQAAAEKILKEKFSSLQTVHFDVNFEDGRGDLTTSIALQVAKKLGLPPRTIAEVLSKGLAPLKGVEKVEIAGAGFVNVTLETGAIIAGLKTARKAFTPMKKRKESPVIVEYSQPNIAKPLGIHHILTTILGQALGNLYEFAGTPVLRWNYMGDWGTQFGKLAVAVERWGGKKNIKDFSIDELLTLYIKFHAEVESDSTLEDAARAAFLKLEQGDKALRMFWEDVVSITKAALGHLYKRLNVHFDLDLSESFYEDKMKPVLEAGKKIGVFVAGKEGSLIVEFSEESKLPPYLVQKGDGATLYSTRDIAQMRYRIDTYHPAAILICTDIAQKLHFEQLVATCDKLGWTLPTFENVLVGRMRFADRSMSTRKGNVLKMEKVLDEAVDRATIVIQERGDKIQTDDPKDLAEMMGIGALVYGVLSQNRRMDMVFDWDKMLSFDGNSAPYLQYTHARARSVLRKAESEGKDAPVKNLTNKERHLLKLIFLFGETVEAARKEHLPHILANYLYELCQAFNSFYASDEILTAPRDTRDFRLHLTAFAADILKTGATILTLRVPERM